MKQPQPATTHRSLKEKQRQEREEMIIQVAEDVLAEKGYYETSMDEIATRVGIAKGTVYLHFPSKEDLVVAIIERDLQQLLVNIDEIIASETSVRGKVEAILQCVYGGIFTKRMQLISSVMNNVDSPRQWKEHGQKLKALGLELMNRISDLLEQGKALGEFDANLPTPIMVNTFFSLLSPRSYVLLVVEGKIAGDELTKYLARIFFHGISPDS